MRLIKPLRILLIILLGINCSGEQPDRKDYFFPLDQFETPQVYVYKLDISYSDIKLYFKLEKTSDSTLKITEYDNDFNQTSEVVNWYTRDGVILMSSKQFQPSGYTLTSEIIKNEVFSFIDNTLSDLQTSTFDTTNQHTELKVSFLNIDKTGHWLGTYTLHASGEMQQTSGRSTGAWVKATFPIEITYTAGIGITYMSYDDGTRRCNFHYDKTNSVKEFEALRVAKSTRE